MSRHVRHHPVERGLHPVGVLAVLQQRAERRGGRGQVELGGAEVGQGARPVEGLRDARRLEQVVAGAQLLDEPDDLAGERLAHLGRPRADDLDLALEARVVDPVVEAAPLERVVQLAGAVGGQHHERRLGRGDGAELRDRHLPGREHLEQERLELVVRAVHLVDQQHRRRLAERGEHRSRQQEPLVVQALLGLVGVDLAGRLERAEVQDLAREVPVVERLAGVDPLVALEADERQPEALRRAPPRARSCRCRARPRAAAVAASARPGRRPWPARRRRGSPSCPVGRRRPLRSPVLRPWRQATTRHVGRTLECQRRVDVGAGREVAALDQRGCRGRRGSRAPRGRPSRPRRRPPSGRARSARGARARRRTPPARGRPVPAAVASEAGHDGRVDVGQVDQRDEGRVVVGRRQGA